MAGLLALTTNPAVGGLGAILIIVLGLVAVLVSVVQIILMLARGGMLVILAGILPTAAAATNTEMGRSWFKKSVSWLVAFILYKPAAAIIYATAFKLAGTSIFKDDGTGLISVLTGLTLMVIALVALPALMRFVTPMVGALAGGGAAATMALAGAAMLPTGAAQIGRLMGGGSGGGGGGSTPSPSSPQGSGTGGTGKAGGDRLDRCERHRWLGRFRRRKRRGRLGCRWRGRCGRASRRRGRGRGDGSTEGRPGGSGGRWCRAVDR